MASLERCKYGFRIVFRFDGKRRYRSVKTHDEAAANAALIRLQENLSLVERGRLTIPDGADVSTFLLTDGKLNGKPTAPQRVSISRLFDEYEKHLPDGALEANSLYTARIHLKHFEKILGPRFVIQDINKTVLQGYVNERAKASGRHGKKISPTTIRKELSTLSTVWSFADDTGYVSGVFPNRGLKFPKTQEKPPFQTWDEIERRIGRGGLSEAEQDELWDCLYLTLPQIKEVLAFVQENARHPFLYPMFSMAAYTGARRSELLRCEVSDFDFEIKTVIIRERKRGKGKRTTRTVPISKALRAVMERYFELHPGGRYVFCHESSVARSKKERNGPEPITVDESNDHFGRTLRGKWGNIRGRHVFRHSFISNCASKGIDQRMIDTWVGHQTDEMRRRYTHLFPDAQHAAMELAFDR